jgi:hypothetical protein
VAAESATWLVVLGDRVGIWWVLSERRMAVQSHRAAHAQELEPGALLLLYASRGAFHNPTRDRGRVIGEARVLTKPAELDKPVYLNDRRFEIGFDLDLTTLVPRGQGVELAPLVDELQLFPARRGWSGFIRKPLVALPPRDADLLRTRLAALAVSGSVVSALESYRVHASLARQPSQHQAS